MGKPKKSKKGKQDEEFGDDDVDLDPLAQNVEQDPVQKTAPKGKKGKKKKTDDWEDDVAAEIEALSLAHKKGQQDDKEEDNLNSEEALPQPKQKKKDKKKNRKKEDSDEEAEEEEMEIENFTKPKGGKKPTGMSAFSMLDMDDDSADELPSSEEEVQAKSVTEKEKQTKKQASLEDEEEKEDKSEETVQQKQQKKGKKDKKKKKHDEEDIDALLAEIEGKTAADKGIDFKDMSSMTQEEIAAAMEAQYEEEEDTKKKKKDKKKKKGGKDEDTKEETEETEEKKEDEEGDEDDEDGGTVKTAAQKKKEKKERQKQKKLEEAAAKKKNKKNKSEQPEAESKPDEEVKMDAADTAKESSVTSEKAEEENKDEGEKEAGEDDEDSKKKKKKDRKKKKGEKEEEKESSSKKKTSKMAQMILEQQRKIKEEEERIRAEMEEKEKKIEEARRQKEEKERLEKEKKEKAKQKKKEKIEKQKKEGTFMTSKQREAQRIAQQKLEEMKKQGYAVPTEEAVKKKKPVYDKKKKKPQQLTSQSSQDEDQKSPTEEDKSIKTEIIKSEEKKKQEEDDVKDAWDASDDDVKDAWDEESEEEKEAEKAVETTTKKKAGESESEEESEAEEESSEEEEEESSEEESSDEESSSDDDMTAQEKARQKAENRIRKRQEDAEKKSTTDVLRAPVVVVLGHVDTGKTKILDKLRRTNVQDNEAGGITQQIGATNVPGDAIINATKMCKEFSKQEMKIPGLLIIDTPGHESFSNLRSRGSSLCDIAILVVDLMHGLEPQTIESINLLKERKTPFVVALNKIDRLYNWQSNPHTDIVNVLKKQKTNTKCEFDERAQQVIVQLAEQGLNAKLFYENKNPKEYISLVPTSAHSGDGMGNLLALICELTQNHLAKRLAYSENLQATVMEVKALPGLGTTVDIILVNGILKEGDTVIIPGTEGPIVTQIRGLLMPQPMKELRVKNAYVHHKEVCAAQGVKIIAKDLDHTLAGLPVYVAQYADEIDIYKEYLEEALEDFLSDIKLQEKGVFVQASTLGSLEALLQFLRDSKIPYAGINIGPVHRKDVMKVSVMLDRDPQYAVILAFDVKVERDAQEMADSLGIRIFTAEIIYHLFDSFMAYRDEYKKNKQEEFKHIAVFPCKLRVLPQYIFNSRDPIVMGVIVEAGFVKIGTPICVPSKENIFLGQITSLELNHKPVEKATKGQEVCIKIENVPGETPKLYGRHFEHTDPLVSKISRESIDAVKEYFRDEMTKADWQVVVELKKLFQIL